ncbi:alkyl hydroperoxide reductase/ thiol specific antioxidant/ Mal allergen [Tilletiaria anomala UBC 951]|uniref:thioredoxin-dependent peroxiredoxin n=1 Tax=Tilletiaria anomala (strain ATCC 24038 / CBS 436.72 / UBC 951) TaxID=1037660 RepID=A0A066VW86_TILAU|nr:alkyl hydroperoxide reductase/ thiol specific antioxidant/ Mal allergen [Tilletiaria anomala UBC 951]KDN45741.1 alkyl hydroperoxide reductase/ thiol specific antioxidant/ Mal allergen [Tilletiaria anomala UBC 951]
MSGLKVGDEAPDVTLPNEDGTSVQLSTLWLDKGPVVVFFYPEDHSYGCTKEVCRFRDGYDDFLSVGAAALVGISKGDQESHTSFRQKQKLQFSLLTDKDGEAQKAFKVKKQLFGLIPGRVTFVVDKEGKIAHVFSSALDL